MILLIDDVRDYHADLIARNGATGIGCLQKFPIQTLMLDHDLGDGITGYEVACWLEENQEYLPTTVELVTSNPVGLEKMAQVFEKLYPYRRGLREFSKKEIK